MNEMPAGRSKLVRCLCGYGPPHFFRRPIGDESRTCPRCLLKRANASRSTRADFEKVEFTAKPKPVRTSG
jgi:hypothetical protein